RSDQIVFDVLAGVLLALEPTGHAATAGPCVVSLGIAIFRLHLVAPFDSGSVGGLLGALPVRREGSLRMDGWKRTFQVSYIVGQAGDQLPALNASGAEEIDVVCTARCIVERNLLVFPFDHARQTLSSPVH